jgi:hypothetical protein
MHRVESCAVLIFPDEIARMRQLPADCAEVVASQPLFVFAKDMTDEAREHLESLGAKVFTLRSFGWTESTHPSQRKNRSPN